MQLRAPRVLALGLGLCVCFRCVRVPPRGVPSSRRSTPASSTPATPSSSPSPGARRRPSQPLPQEPDIIRHDALRGTLRHNADVHRAERGEEHERRVERGEEGVCVFSPFSTELSFGRRRGRRHESMSWEKAEERPP
ncbi:hypothetical protein B0H14DRAFT_1238989 [Mycena olivaceomarginata]|nr:hypothetical protein B0H14DRAFT_1238989 [Mycena olivaceomarginata]